MSTREALMLALVVLVPVGCRQEPNTSEKKKTAPKAQKVAEAPTTKPARPRVGNKALWVAFQEVLANCEVSEWGFVGRDSCKKPRLEEQLKRREREAGQKATLLTYCAALGGENHIGRALASYRISSLNSAQRMAEAADEELLECLLRRFAEVRRSQHVRRLALAVTYMGTALKRERGVIAAVEKHPMREAREASYGALWANGRLRVFEALAKAIKNSGDPKLQVAAIKSFGYGSRPTPAERKKICDLLAPHLADRDMDVASAAAYRVAALCPARKDDVVAAARALIAQGRFTLGYVSAMRAAAGLYRYKATDAQRRAIVAVLQRVLESGRVVALTRSSALATCFDIDPRAGKRLARRYLKDKAKFVADEAARISRRRAR